MIFFQVKYSSSKKLRANLISLLFAFFNFMSTLEVTVAPERGLDAAYANRVARFTRAFEISINLLGQAILLTVIPYGLYFFVTVIRNKSCSSFVVLWTVCDLSSYIVSAFFGFIRITNIIRRQIEQTRVILGSIQNCVST
jgi:hypothetical protein